MISNNLSRKTKKKKQKKKLKTFGNIKLEKYNMTELFGTTIFMNEVNQERNNEKFIFVLHSYLPL